MGPVEWTIYPDLDSYSVLAVNDLIVPNTNTLTINGQDWYSINYNSVDVNGTAVLNYTDNTSAAGQLNSLVTMLNPTVFTQRSWPILDILGVYNITIEGAYDLSLITLDPNLTINIIGSTTTDQFLFYNGDSGTTIIFAHNTSITNSGNSLNKNIFFYNENTIKFSDIDAPINVCGTFISNTSILFVQQCNLYGRVYSNSNIEFSNDENYSTVNSEIVCYAKGTLILTQHGFVPIEKIKVGHQIVTKGKIKHNAIKEVEPDLKPVLWISSFKVTKPNKKSNPICIKKNTFGATPFKDLYVSPEHSLIIDNKLITAKRLVNDDTIYQADWDEVVYYHIEFEEHCAIFANGVLTESYLDADNRYGFEKSLKLTKDEIEHIDIKDVKVKHLRKYLSALKSNNVPKKLI